MKKDKIHLFVLAALTVTLFGGLGLYVLQIPVGDLGAGEVFTILLPLTIVLFMIVFITKRYKDVKAGMPLEDERSKRVMTKAAAVSFYATLYWLLFISWFEEPIARLVDLERLDAGQTVGGAILGMAITFAISWAYYHNKGKLD